MKDKWLLSSFMEIEKTFFFINASLLIQRFEQRYDTDYQNNNCPCTQMVYNSSDNLHSNIKKMDYTSNRHQV